MMKILVLDNYDSFVYNLVHAIKAIKKDATIAVFRNDAISLERVAAYDKILLSPGPGLPLTAGIMPQLIQQYAATKSIFGVCLGHQAIGEAFGAKLHNLNQVLHGMAKTTIVQSDDEPLFKNMTAQFQAGRYHSWVIHKDKLGNDLKVTATDKDGEIMAIRHREYDVCGVQFHPESILTPEGNTIISNWLNHSK